MKNKRIIEHASDVKPAQALPRVPGLALTCQVVMTVSCWSFRRPSILPLSILYRSSIENITRSNDKMTENDRNYEL
jgi:hypothetical protein